MQERATFDLSADVSPRPPTSDQLLHDSKVLIEALQDELVRNRAHIDRLESKVAELLDELQVATRDKLKREEEDRRREKEADEVEASKFF